MKFVEFPMKPAVVPAATILDGCSRIDGKGFPHNDNKRIDRDNELEKKKKTKKKN